MSQREMSPYVTVDGEAAARETRRGADAESPTSGVVPADGPPVVLVVDDDAGLRAAVRRALERRAYAVVEASGGREALATLADGVAVNFVVTDLRMADGSGGWLLAQIGYEHPHLLPRTVVMSGDTAGVAAAHLASRWRCPVLTKPFTAPQLADALARLADQGH